MAISWENLDTLVSYKKLQSLKGAVSVAKELSGADAAISNGMKTFIGMSIGTEASKAAFPMAIGVESPASLAVW